MKKYYYESKNNYEDEIKGKDGRIVKFKTVSVYGSGEAYYFKDYALSRQFTTISYRLSDGALKSWPIVKWIVSYDSENDALLIEDYIEGIIVDEGFDENPLVSSIFYYISLDGKILSGAYNDITNKIYPLDKLEGKEIYPNFEKMYLQTKASISKSVSEELKSRRLNVTYNKLSMLKTKE